MRLVASFVVLTIVSACRQGEPSHAQLETATESVASQQPSPVGEQKAAVGAPTCARPARGIIVGHDTIAGFAIRDTLGALRQQCTVGVAELYDAVGWQAVAWTFPFVGARVMAVQSNHPYGESVHNDEVADRWIVQGDSVRMPDGELLPRTLGALRARYGYAIVDDNVQGDDMDGPGARLCRFPYLSFALGVTDTARKVSDSARVTHVEMDTPGVDTVMTHFCASHSDGTRDVGRGKGPS